MFELRHRRLYAFQNSKVLNLLMIILVVFLLIADATESLLLPVVCGMVALLCFIGYSIWLWICKPQVIIINTKLSEISGLLTLYFLIIVAINPDNIWWFIIPVAVTILSIFVTMLKNNDSEFAIPK